MRNLIIILLGSFVYAQNVYIPDPIFKSCLLDNPFININGDNEIQYSEAEVYNQFINCSEVDLYTGIQDTSGLETFIQVESIALFSSPDLSTINLAQNTELRQISLVINSLNSIDISQNLILEFFELESSEVSQLDFSVNAALIGVAIEENPNLTQINLANGNNENLQRLFIYFGLENLQCVQIDEGFTIPPAGNYLPDHYWDYDDPSIFSTDCYEDLSVEESVKNENEIVVYPNPVNDILNIKSQEEIQQIQLFNAQGKLVKTVFELKTVDMSNLSIGEYVVIIQTEKGSVSKKVIKK